MKSYRYRVTIRVSSLLLFRVYFAVSLLPFGASRQPKYVGFYLLSLFAESRIVSLFVSRKGFI